MNIEEAVQRGKQKTSDFKQKKSEKIEDKFKNRAATSVNDMLVLIDTYCQLFDIQHQFRPTQKAKGQLKQWIKAWECPVSCVFSFDEYIKLMIEKWVEYCTSKFNYSGIPATCFNISLLMDRPKLLASVNMFLNQDIKKVEPEKTEEFKDIRQKEVRKINIMQI